MGILYNMKIRLSRCQPVEVKKIRAFFPCFLWMGQVAGNEMLGAPAKAKRTPEGVLLRCQEATKKIFFVDCIKVSNSNGSDNII